MRRSIKAYVVCICMFATLFSNVMYAQETEKLPLQQEITEYSPCERMQQQEEENATGVTQADTAALDFSEQADYIRQKMQQREETIEVTYDAVGFSGQEVINSLKSWGREMMREAMCHTGDPQQGDYLKWQYGSWNMKMRTQVEQGVWKAHYVIQVEYYTNMEQERIVTQQVSRLLQDLPLKGKNDYEKTEVIYDWVCKNVSYDYEGLADENDKIKYTAYGALQNRKAVCQGYANLMYRLLNELGIDCRLVSGYGQKQPHAWNIVKLGKYYYNIDATWDAVSQDHSYFLKGSGDFKEHTCNDQDMEEDFWDTHTLSRVNFNPSNFEREEPSITSYPSEPSKGSEPSEPSEVSRASEPDEPSRVSESSRPSEPSKGSEPSKPSEVSRASEPDEASEGSEPSKPSEASEPDEPSKPSENSVIDEPSQPEQHVHSYQRQITQATVEADGKIVDVCICGDKKVIQKIVHPKKIMLGYNFITYTGDVVHPTVRVFDRRGEEIGADHYRITYSRGCRKVGVYRVRVTFSDNYVGVMYTSFTIKPPKTDLKLCANSATAMKVQWTRQRKQVQGYQIQYSVTPTFRSSSSRTIQLTGNTKNQCVIRGRGAYYVRIRTYCIVANKKIYSDWSNRCQRF